MNGTLPVDGAPPPTPSPPRSPWHRRLRRVGEWALVIALFLASRVAGSRQNLPET